MYVLEGRDITTWFWGNGETLEEVERGRLTKTFVAGLFSV